MRYMYRETRCHCLCVLDALLRHPSSPYRRSGALLIEGKSFSIFTMAHAPPATIHSAFGYTALSATSAIHPGLSSTECRPNDRKRSGNMTKASRSVSLLRQHASCSSVLLCRRFRQSFRPRIYTQPPPPLYPTPQHPTSDFQPAFPTASQYPPPPGGDLDPPQIEILDKPLL